MENAACAQADLENHYGYKSHINADQGHKRVQGYLVTAASVHDSRVFEVLLNQSEGDSDKRRAIYADSA